MTVQFVHPENLGESIHLLVQQAETGVPGILDPRLTLAAAEILSHQDAQENRAISDGVSAQGYPDESAVVFMNAYRETLIVRVTPASRRHEVPTQPGTITLVSVSASKPDDGQQVFLL